MILCISAMSVVTYPFSFLILFIWVLSLFFLMSLARGWSVLFILSKNQLLVSLIFVIISFISFSFISDLIFMISFFLQTLGFACSFFSSSFRCMFRLFIWDFPCFSRWDFIAMNFPLGASLVVQWLRVCLPMWGTRVRALVWEDPTCRRATRPVSHNCWACASGACALQQERPWWWEAHAPQWRVAPTCHNWRKPLHRNEDPTQP